jgi:hypothetical protein
MASERRYPNLIGVFARAFPIITGQVMATQRAEIVKWHGQTYRIEPQPNSNASRYSFDVVLVEAEHERRSS